MYNETAARRRKYMAKAYEHLDEAREYIYSVIYDEIDQSETITFDQMVEKISDVMDSCLPYVNEPDEADLADDFLYGRL